MMSAPEIIQDIEFITTLTLRINFKELTFKDSTKTERTDSRSSKPRCSCAILHEIHPYHSVRNIAQGLKPTDVVTARFVMTSKGNVEQAAKLCTPDVDLKFEHLREFEYWILSLAVLLAELCEGSHSPKSRETPPIYGLRPFREGKVSKRSVCEDIRRLLMTPLNPTEKTEHGMGYIYILRSQFGPSTLGELKIGFSKYHPEHRAHEIASCYALPEVISHTPLLPHAKRLESIIHVELQSIRKIHSCPKCKGNHQEWFTIMHGDSREIVMRWSRWILQQPYVNGDLTQEWKTHLASKDFGSVDEDISLATFWQSIIDNVPQPAPHGSESERIGAYLNQCHWDNFCTQIGVDDLEKITKCDGCRQYGAKVRMSKAFPLPFPGDEKDGAARQLIRMGLATDEPQEFCKCDEMTGPAYLKLTQGIDPDQLFGNVVDKSTREHRMFHPATPLRYIMDREGSSSPFWTLLRRQQEEEDSAHVKMFDHLVSIKDIKTGARSVSDPYLGRTESPLGDATLLPVLALKDLDHIGGPVSGWVGYNPTHYGFQYLQEAYKKGQWFGRRPQFKLPKAYRHAGLQAIPMPDPRRGKGSDTEMRDVSELSDNASPIPDPVMQHRKHPGSRFTLGRGSGFGSESFTSSFPVDAESIELLEQLTAVCKIPAGRYMVEREGIRALRRHGVDACFDLPEVSDDSSSDEVSSSDGRCRVASSPPITPAQRAVDLNPQELQITPQKAKEWLRML